jgi:hypothetical protein
MTPVTGPISAVADSGEPTLGSILNATFREASNVFPSRLIWKLSSPVEFCQNLCMFHVFLLFRNKPELATLCNVLLGIVFADGVFVL